MKKIEVLLLPILGLLLVGCTNDITPAPFPAVTSPISFVGSKSVSSDFASSSGFLSGSQVGFYLTSASAGLAERNNPVHNALFTASASGFAAHGVVYPSDIASCDVYAYAPYVSSALDAAKSITFSVAAQQTTAEPSDLLWVRQQGVASGSVPTLVFDHKLSQIVVTLTAAQGVVLVDPVVKLVGTLPTILLNVETGVLGTVSGVTVPIVATKITDNEMRAIVVPQTMAQNASFIWVENGGKTFKHTLNKGQTFVSGYSYRYEITVKDNSIDVQFTGGINGWSAGESTTGDAV